MSNQPSPNAVRRCTPLIFLYFLLFLFSPALVSLVGRCAGALLARSLARSFGFRLFRGHAAAWYRRPSCSDRPDAASLSLSRRPHALYDARGRTKAHHRALISVDAMPALDGGGGSAANAERSKRLAEEQAEKDRKNAEKAARRAAALAASTAAATAPAAAAAKDDDDDDDAPPPLSAAADATAAPALPAVAVAASGTKSTATLTPVQKFTEADGDAETISAASAGAAVAAGAGGGDAAEEEPEAYKGEKPNAGNGGKGPHYEWTQTLKDLVVTVPVPLGTTGKTLVINITKDHIKVGRKGEASALLDGKLHKQCRPEEVIWTIDDNEDDTGRIITLEIPKKNQVGGGSVRARVLAWGT